MQSPCPDCCRVRTNSGRLHVSDAALSTGVNVPALASGSLLSTAVRPCCAGCWLSDGGGCVAIGVAAGVWLRAGDAFATAATAGFWATSFSDVQAAAPSSPMGAATASTLSPEAWSNAALFSAGICMGTGSGIGERGDPELGLELSPEFCSAGMGGSSTAIGLTFPSVDGEGDISSSLTPCRSAWHNKFAEFARMAGSNKCLACSQNLPTWDPRGCRRTSKKSHTAYFSIL